MKNILVLGAGRSSSALINYLLKVAAARSWQVTLGDFSEKAARERIGNSKAGRAIGFDMADAAAGLSAIHQADVVVSMLPAHFHPKVATLCLSERKHLLTASYVSDEMKLFHDEAASKGLLFLNECGLDPGIDHMSAMHVIDRIKDSGGVLTSFESFTGGLIAPETDPQNPWRYKFTWNPRNVVMAGQGTARFLQEGQYKFIPYQRLFERTTAVSVPGFGEYEGYANRDSLKYLDTYGLRDIKTMLRGTLRNKGYCSAWNILVQAGCCDDTFLMEGVANMTHRGFINAFLDFHNTHTVEEKLCAAFGISENGEEMKRLRWSGLFEDEKIGIEKGTPAQVLEHILNKKWRLSPGDKDLIVMWHRFRYKQDGRPKEIQAYLTTTGEDEVNTAMAKTVGLPLALATQLLLEGKIQSRGVRIPVEKEIYGPVLAGLASLGIQLKETEL